jgi:AraC family transcriptional regulator
MTIAEPFTVERTVRITVNPADFAPAIRIIEKRFRFNPSFTEMAKACSLSPFHFHRRFTIAFSKTPKQMVTEKQIALAKELLLAGKRALPDIAKHCGWAHQSHMTDRFRRVVGLPPRRWAKAERAKLRAEQVANVAAEVA